MKFGRNRTFEKFGATQKLEKAMLSMKNGTFEIIGATEEVQTFEKKIILERLRNPGVSVNSKKNNVLQEKIKHSSILGVPRRSGSIRKS